MNFAFVTCVELGLSCMKEIYNVGGSLRLVISLKDTKAVDKSGRIYVDEFCKKNSIEVLKVNNINDNVALEKIKELEIDWLFIIGWSQIAKQEILEAPTKGVLGMHPTLLPVGRGRASIPWAILKDLPETGVTLFKLDNGVDTGPILYQEKIRLNSDTNATQLYSNVNKAHVLLIRNVWEDLTNNRLVFRDQNEEFATIWEGRTPSDGKIESNMSVHQVEKLVRATTHPYPGAFWELNDRKIVIWAGKVLIQNDRPSIDSYILSFFDGKFEATDYEYIYY